MRVSRLLCLWLAAAVVVIGSQPALGQAKPAIPPMRVQNEPLDVRLGDPLSPQSLVRHPPEIKGIISWTIESRMHRGAISGAAVSPDGRYLATGGIDGTLRLWDLKSGKLAAIMINGHYYGVGSVAWSPCGTVIAASGGSEGVVRLWDPESRHQLRRIRNFKTHPGHITWSPDNARLAVAGGTSGTISIWTAANDDTRVLIELGRALYSLQWSPDSQALAFSRPEAPVSILSLATGKVTKSFGEVGDGHTTVAWSPDGTQLAAGGRRITIWNVADGSVVHDLKGTAYHLAWSPDGTQLAAAVSSYIQIWDTESGKPVSKVPAPATRALWLPDSQRIIAIYSDQFSMWQLGDKPRQLIDVDCGGPTPPRFTAGRPVITGLGSTKLRLWDQSTAKSLGVLEGKSGPISTVTWAKDAKTLASVGNDSMIQLWDVKACEPAELLKGHTAPVTALVWSPDGRWLASAGADKTVRLWSPDGECKAVYDEHAGPIRALAWAPAGNALASGSDDLSIRIWRPGESKSSRVLKAFQPVWSLSYTTVGKVLVLACGTTQGMLQVFNGGSGRLLAQTRFGDSSVMATTWLPGVGHLFLGGSVWDVGANKAIYTLKLYHHVLYNTYASNGAILVTGSYDRTTRFWDAGTGQYRGAMVREPESLAMVTSDGHWRADPDSPCDLLYVVQTSEGQVMLTPDEFAERFRWRNNPAKIKLVPR